MSSLTVSDNKSPSMSCQDNEKWNIMKKNIESDEDSS